jgi:hypothetical protein
MWRFSEIERVRQDKDDGEKMHNTSVRIGGVKLLHNLHDESRKKTAKQALARTLKKANNFGNRLLVYGAFRIYCGLLLGIAWFRLILIPCIGYARTRGDPVGKREEIR